MSFASITGIGMYLPERRLTNADLERMVDTSDDWIVSRTGIRERRVAAPDQTTSDLAARAGTAALADAGIAAEDIDLLIVGTASPDMIFPATACLAQAKLGLTCAAYDINAACSSFIYGLHAAASHIEAGRARNVLLIGAEAITRHIDFTDRTTCVLFGDGAGAIVLSASEKPGVLSVTLGADGGGADLLGIPAGGATRPSTIERCELGEQFLRMNGTEVFKFAVLAIPKAVRQALKESGVSAGDLAWLVPHQANQRILDTVADRLHVPHERVFSNIAVTGNTSSASIPLALNDLYTSGRLRRTDLVALVGFGAGLTWGAAVVRWTKEGS